MRLATIAPALAIACSGGGKSQVQIGPPPMKLTKGVLTGANCSEGHCACRSGPDDGGVGLPTDGRKRFEIKMESAYDLWVMLPGGTVLYKDPEKTTACFYVDLAPGKHPMTVRASHKNGVSLAVEVHELGTKTKSWYDTFQFACGNPGVCSFAELDDKKKQLAAITRGLWDTCGSTKIKGVQWDHGRSPDQEHPEDLQLELQLDVYKFAPWKAHGDSTCGEGGGRKGPDGEPAPEEPAN